MISDTTLSSGMTSEVWYMYHIIEHTILWDVVNRNTICHPIIPLYASVKNATTKGDIIPDNAANKFATVFNSAE